MKRKSLRDGLDVRVALVGRPSQSNKLVSSVTDSPLPAVDAPGPARSRPGIRGAARRVLRPVAKFGWRVIRPLGRPVFFRARGFFVEPLAQQSVNEFQQLNATLVRETRAMTASLGRQLNESDATAQRRFEGLQEIAVANGERLDGLRETAVANSQRLDDLRETAVANSQRLDDLRETAVANSHRLDALRHDVLQLQVTTQKQETRTSLTLEYSAAAARRVAIPDGTGNVLIRTAVGYLLCDATDYALVVALVETGELECGTRQLIERVLVPGDVFVDVGANVGMHTLAAARAVGKGGHVFAFEPFPATATLLEKSVWLNGLSDVVTVFPVALSDKRGTSDLYLGATSGHHSLFPLDAPLKEGPGTVPVPTETLDAVLPAGSRIDLMKIDVEGAELEVLRGAEAILRANPEAALILEYGPSHLTRVGVSSRDWFDALEAFGLRGHVINESDGSLSDVRPADLQGVESTNLFFAPPRGVRIKRARR